MSSNAEVPYWVLMSVLFSSFPMTQSLASALHGVAVQLYSADATSGLVDHQLARGTVRNQRSEAVIGTVTGPVFEAQLETERGKGMVRFLLTREGLSLLGATANTPRGMMN
jgi:hypothetical protein